MKISKFNTDHVKNLSEQMKKNTDPDVIKVLAKQHMKQVSDIASSITKEQQEIVSKLLPILKLPSPTPPSILKWVTKVATGFAMPQMEASIKLVQQSAEVASAVSEISSALAEVQKIISEIQEVSDELKGELNSIVGDALGSVGDLVSQADGLISDTLSVVENAQSLMNNVTGGTAAFDLSSPQAFLASADSGIASFKSDAAAVLNAVAPKNEILPTFTGTAEVGQVLTMSSNGTWTGTDPIAFAFQWQRDGHDIPGATANTYTLAMDDYGKVVSCYVTADNKADHVGINTSTTEVVVAYPPTNTVDPSISGTAQVGQVLTCNAGTWTGTATIGYSYQWVRNDSAIFGANTTTYTAVTADVGATLKCAVTATNPVSSVMEVTAPTAAVIA